MVELILAWVEEQKLMGEVRWKGGKEAMEERARRWGFIARAE